MHGNSLSQTHAPQLNQTEQKQSNSELQTNINKNIQDSQPSYFLPQQLSHTEPQLQQMSLIDTIEQFQKNNHFPEKIKKHVETMISLQRKHLVIAQEQQYALEATVQK